MRWVNSLLAYVNSLLTFVNSLLTHANSLIAYVNSLLSDVNSLLTDAAVALMKKDGVTPDMFIYSGLLYVAGKIGRVEKVAELEEVNFKV